MTVSSIIPTAPFISRHKKIVWKPHLAGGHICQLQALGYIDTSDEAKTTVRTKRKQIWNIEDRPRRIFGHISILTIAAFLHDR